MEAMPLLILIALHVASGVVAVACGAGAMLTRKGSRRHRRFGRAYVIVLVLLCGTAAVLAGLDWAHRWHLVVLGAIALSCAGIGYGAVRLARPARIAVHLGGMGVGYLAMLTAFYVDNGPRLPLWNLLPPLWLWLLPAAIGIPIIVRAVLRLARPPVRRTSTFDGLRPSPVSAGSCRSTTTTCSPWACTGQRAQGAGPRRGRPADGESASVACSATCYSSVGLSKATGT